MKRILIVEDNRDLHEFYRYVLGGEMIEMTFRTSATEAFDDARRTRFDLIILDILMDSPGFNGIGFLMRLRKQLRSRTPVIIATVLDWEVCRGIRHIGSFSFLQKPFTPEMLLKEVGRSLKA